MNAIASLNAANDNDGARLFTPAIRESMEAMRAQVAHAISWPVSLAYGAMDDGSQHWAALFVRAEVEVSHRAD
jgi:hypothetical protein